MHFLIAFLCDVKYVFQNLEADLTEARGQMEILHNKCTDLTSQLHVKETELTQKDVDVTRARYVCHISVRHS